jgi:hypothetical protein
MHGEWYLSSWGYPFRDVRSLIKPQMTWVKNSSKGSKAKAIWFRRTKVAQRPNRRILPPPPLAPCRHQVRNSFESGVSGFSGFNRALLSTIGCLLPASHPSLPWSNSQIGSCKSQMRASRSAYFLWAPLCPLLDALFLRTENLVQKNLKLVP